MTKLCTPLICLGLFVAFTGCTKNPSTKNPSQTGTQGSPFPGQHGWDPTEACGFLSDQLKPGQYKSEDGNVYGCLSSAKDLGAGSPLPNTIVYFVGGDAQRARQMGLVLTVNNPASAEDAHKVLLEYSRELSEKALGVPLSQAVTNAILSGTKGRGKVDTTKVEILRQDSANGKGYELHYVITPQL